MLRKRSVAALSGLSNRAQEKSLGAPAIVIRHRIVIGNQQTPHSGRRQIRQSGRTQPAATSYQHRSRQQLFLPFQYRFRPRAGGGYSAISPYHPYLIKNSDFRGCCRQQNHSTPCIGGRHHLHPGDSHFLIHRLKHVVNGQQSHAPHRLALPFPPAPQCCWSPPSLSEATNVQIYFKIHPNMSQPIEWHSGISSRAAWPPVPATRAMLRISPF